MMTGEREKELMSAAGVLLEARRTNTPIDDLPAAVRPATLEEAYFIQDRLALAYGEIGGGEGRGSSRAGHTGCFPRARGGVALQQSSARGSARCCGRGGGDGVAV